jgi:hypothetical protein
MLLDAVLIAAAGDWILYCDNQLQIFICPLIRKYDPLRRLISIILQKEA